MPKMRIDHSWYDSTLDTDERVDALVGAMTLREKIAQMLHEAPPIPRLGVPAYNWWNECLHGVARAGHATVFPQAPIQIGLHGRTIPSPSEIVAPKIVNAVKDVASGKAQLLCRQHCRPVRNDAAAGMNPASLPVISLDDRIELQIIG